MNPTTTPVPNNVDNASKDGANASKDGVNTSAVAPPQTATAIVGSATTEVPSQQPVALDVPKNGRRASVEEVEDEDDRAARARKGGESEDSDDADVAEPKSKSKSKGKGRSKRNPVPTDLPADIPNEIGHRNWAKGICEEKILEPGVGEYADAMRSGNRAAVRAFIQKKTNQYIFQLGWRSSLKAQPSTLPVWDETMILEEDKGLSAAEERAKAWIIEQTCERIARWYAYRYDSTLGRGVKVGNPEDPYSVLLGDLAGISTVKKAQQGYQQYMHELYTLEIGHVVNSRWAIEPDKPADASRAAPAWYRAKIARELFKLLPEDRQADLKDRAKANAQRQRDEYAERVREASEQMPETLQRATDGLAAAMQPVIQGISEATGLQFFLVGGGPMPRYGGEIRTVHMSIGQNKAAAPTSFPKWKKVHFDKEILGSFKGYLETAFTAADHMKVALPNTAQSTALLDDPDLISMDSSSTTTTASPATTTSSSTSTSSPSTSTSSPSTTTSSSTLTSSPTATTTGSKRKAASSSKVTLSADEDDSDDEEADHLRRRKFADMRNANIARNKTLLEGLKIKEAMSGLFPAAKKPTQRNARQPKPATATTGRVRRSQRNATTSEGEPMDVVNDSVFVTPADASSSGPAPEDASSSGPAPEDVSMEVDSQAVMQVDSEVASAILECPDDAAEWVREVYGEFATENLGKGFNAVIEAFLELHRSYGWINGSGYLPTEHRPKQVSKWIQNHRVAKPAYCSIGNATVYAKQWWAWWTGMQPEWRGRTVDGKPGDGNPEGESWDGLYVSGMNGMLNVVVSLYWWGCHEKSRGLHSQEWTLATEDVAWALNAIAVAVEADL
ncbi:hypothetical protein C8F01DRAFT_1255447 [Mycena amicta]|nr:hypothetical protein C8F01DRAFT_1255447 [Mycena amicta]